jgi:hypothetical protein
MPPKGFLLSNKPIVLWIHDLGLTHHNDAIVNPEIFPNFRDGQLLRIHCPPEQEKDQQTQEQEAAEYVIVKGYAPDKESLTKQLQVNYFNCALKKEKKLNLQMKAFHIQRFSRSV